MELEIAERDLSDLEKQLQAAKEQVTQPFPQEQEYAEKSARLRELNILLNMDERDPTVFDMEPDEHDAVPERQKTREYAMAR